jgi:hydroxyacylglutathione hydrolase
VAEAAGEVVVRGFTGGAFAENTYLVSCAATGEAILVDPGAAAAAAVDAAEAAGLRIGAIVLTHAHLDHVEGIPLVRARAGAPVRLHPDDRALYEGAPAQAGWFGMHLDPLPPPDGTLAEGEPVRFGECALDVRLAPGHAPGHVILVGDGVALVGDVVFAGSIGRTDLPGGDYDTLIASIRTVLFAFPDDTPVYSGHGEPTTIGRERRTNPFLVGS